MKKQRRLNKSNFADSYTGELAVPIEPDFVGTLDESDAEFSRRLVEQLAVNFNKLFDWYGIDPNGPNAGVHLALKLAMAHVPGMQFRREPHKRGRKRTWKAGLASELVRDVAALQKINKLSYKRAIAQLKKQKRWGGYTIPNLITRHREARKDDRRLAEELAASPLWKLGQKYGMRRNDGNSDDQN